MRKGFVWSILLVMIVGALFIAAHQAGAWELGDMVHALFSEKPRFSGQPGAANNQNTRGRAEELRPDISVPPPAATAAQPYSSEDEKAFNSMLSTLENVALAGPENDHITDFPTQVVRAPDAVHKIRWSPPPPGFLTADTFNYLIYREKNPVSANLKTVLDTIHGNLMLDLTPFTVVMKPGKILVMLFGEKETYHDFTKLPPWSGAASDLKSDTMYVIEGNSFYALSVHELTHLYFDGYFLPTISPLWLSEGMAVYMQIYASKQKPAWIDHSLRRILSGQIIPLEEMTATEDLSKYDSAQAELWYTQAYSVVDYFLNRRNRDEFYKFCTELKNNTPIHQALYRAYGMPFNKVSALENVWLHDLQKAYQKTQPQAAAQPQMLAPVVAQPAPASTAPVTPTAKPAPAPRPAPKPAPKPAPQKTQINKLQMVPTNTLYGGSR